MEKPYKLSCCLYGHSSDVRALAVTSNNAVLSGSRDKTARFWKPNSLNAAYSEEKCYKDHKNYVASVLYLEPSDDFPDGLILTGGNDSEILIYKTGETSPSFSIKEHTNTVSCMSKGIVPNSFLSGSWDTTGKFWILNKESPAQTSKVTLNGHKAAVWSIIQLQDSRIITASADRLIHMWNIEGKLLQALIGHSDCVRGLCDMPDYNYFLSVSNDACIKTWSYSGENLDTLYGHTNYIYSVAKHSNTPNSFVTSDENRSVRVWKDGVNTQTFQLPAQSVWTVATLSNGDIVTGSSDGVARIFTQNESRFADAETLSKFEEEVNALNARNLEEIGGYKVSDLPGQEALNEPGKRAGQMKMIREGSGVTAYTWMINGNQGNWQKVGDVLGAKKEGEGKTMFEGKPYDFVFSVDVEDGKPPLKLPYNKGEDPYTAAQAFLIRNALPSVYLEQVVDFILKNSQEQYTPSNSGYVDPFTGGSRYMPTGNNAQTFQGTNVDPFTGGSSYATGTSMGTAPNMGISSGMNSDPFTGGMSYTTNSMKMSNYFPQKEYLSFDLGDQNVILNKLKEFNRKIGDSSNAIDEKYLEEFVSLSKGYTENPVVFDTLFKLLKWPEDMIFPVLDVIRLAVRYQKNNEMILSYSEEMMERFKYFISENCTVINNTIVALRTLSNLCLHNAGESVVFDNRFDIVEHLTSLNTNNKNAQVAISTLLLNLTVLSEKKKDELGVTVLADVVQDILCKLSDPESQFRMYVALGTLLSSNLIECKEIRLKLKTNPNFVKVLENHCSFSNNEVEKKRTECSNDVKKLL